MTIRFACRFLAVTALFLATSAAFAQQPVKLRFTLDWRFEGQLAYFMMAKNKRYFERAGLDVQVDSGTGSGAAIARIVGGSHDIGTGDMTALIEYLGNNPGETRLQAVYLIYNTTPFMIQGLKKSGMTKPQDLAGKKIAAPVFDSTRKTFPIFANIIGIDPASVTFVNVDPALRETLVARGEVDASAGFELHKLTMIARGVKEEDIVAFRLADYGFNMYGNAILASSKLIAENPGAVAAFVRASNQALIDTIANPAEAIKYNKEFDALINEKLELEKLKITLRAIDTEFAHSNGLGAISKPALEKQVEDVAWAFKLKSKPNADLLFNPNFLPPKSDRVPRR
jgi:NitT/TauT family transport system substrate-binding protein